MKLKKIGTMAVVALSLWVGGCQSPHSQEESESLSDYYFKTSEVLAQGESVAVNKLPQTLGEATEDLGTIKVFEKGAEKLTVEVSADQVASLMYDWHDSMSKLTVAQENMVSKTSVVAKDEAIRDLLNETPTKMLGSYQEVASRMSEETVTIDEIRSMFNIEPEVSEEVNEDLSEVTDYSFVVGDMDEVMHAYTLKGEDKVIKLTYGSNVTGDIYTTLYQDNEPLYITSSTRTTLTEQKQIFDGLHQ